MNETMKIRDIFLKNIDRDINGVIQAGQLDEESVFQELDEYVMTRELEENFATFYRHYSRSLIEPTTKIGVWISGFFGSGKSHFLKILSYLLDNRMVQERHASDFFREKDIDPTLLDWMEDASEVDSDALLFNIDSKSSTTVGNQKQKIVDVFLKVFNEHLGYSRTGFIAEIERMLEEEEKYEAFKEAFAKLEGKSWESTRQSILLKQKVFVEAMGAVGIDEESARTFLKTTKDTFEIASDELAKRIAAYCKKRGKRYRLIFLIDEIGQYVGDDTQLMLNLQTVVEDLGTHARGQVWVVVTSQEKIDALTNLRGDDFSKIQGRFSTRLNLSSANTDEVIKRRLLTKTEVAEDTLRLEYESGEQSLKNMLSFDNRTIALRSGYASLNDFISSYPFVPYQIELLQKVFNKIRKQGEAGKHLANGERSLLNAFQEVAQSMKGESTRKLATFSMFYATVESFLDSTVKSTVRKAASRDGINEFDLSVLKTLYMIKGIDELPATVENIATLLIDELNAIKNEIERKVSMSLQRLQRQMLIQQNADQTYMFLSDEEQEINREIKNEIIDPEKVIEKMGKEFFDELYQKSRYRANTGHDFDFTKRFNQYTRGTTAHPLTLQVYSADVSSSRAALEANSGVLVMHLPDYSTAYDAFEYALQVHAYVNKKESLQKSPVQKRIMDEKRAEITSFEEKGKVALQEACKEAIFYVQGQEYRFNGEVAGQIDKAFEVLVRNTFTKLSYIEDRVEVRQAAKTIKDWALQGLPASLIDGSRRNHLALVEVERYLEEKQAGHVRTTLKSVIEDFTREPYGWSDIDVAGLVAVLLNEGKVKLVYLGDRLTVEHSRFSDLMTKQSEREKVIVEAEVAVPQAIRNRVLKLAKEFFGQFAVGETYDAIAEGITQQITQYMLEPLQEMESRRRSEHPDFPYPGQMDILRLRKLTDELLAIRMSEQLVQEFLDREDEYEQWFDKLEDLSNFFLKSAVSQFDEAVRILQHKRSDLISAHDQTEIQSIKQQMETILRSEQPYNQIRQLPILMGRLTEQLQKLLEQKRADLAPKFARMEQEIVELTQMYQKDSELAPIILRGTDSLKLTIQECERVDSVGDLVLYANMSEQKLSSLQTEIKRKLDARGIVQRPQPDQGVSPTPKGAKIEKVLTPVELVVLSMADTQSEVRIENLEELEEYLQGLRKEMEELLTQHVVIIKK